MDVFTNMMSLYSSSYKAAPLAIAFLKQISPADEPSQRLASRSEGPDQSDARCQPMSENLFGSSVVSKWKQVNPPNVSEPFG